MTNQATLQRVHSSRSDLRSSVFGRSTAATGGGRYVFTERVLVRDVCVKRRAVTRYPSRLRWGHLSTAALGATTLLLLAGCVSRTASVVAPERPDIGPVGERGTASTLSLDASHIEPMHTELLAIDLATVAQVAVAENFDVLQARQQVVAMRGEYESVIGAAFPVVVPTAVFEHVEGKVRATEGNLVSVGFNTFQPSIAVQWVLNPGRVIYDIVAARKRLAASEHQERAVTLATLRDGIVQYYDLVLRQARVSAAHQGVAEAEELERINRVRVNTGTGVPADMLRAKARLAERRQELIIAMRVFYESSVTLALTLRLDSSVTLLPAVDELPLTQLVRTDLSLEDLMGIAVLFRPDLESVRTLVDAVQADSGSTWWGGLGPQLQASYQYGGMMGHANNINEAAGIPGNLIINPASPSGAFSTNPTANGLIKEGILRSSKGLGGRNDQTYGLRDQQRGGAEVGWRLGLAIFGDLKKAKAVEAQAVLEAERLLERVKAQVVVGQQESKASRQIVDLAGQQVIAAEEAYRLIEANLRVGTVTTLDSLQAQDAVTRARLGYAEAVVRYNQSQVELLAALGVLDSRSLGLP